MTRQALAELSALLAQRAVMAPPSQVAKDALKLARYAEAARSLIDRTPFPMPTEAQAQVFWEKAAKIVERASPHCERYTLTLGFDISPRPLRLKARPNTPPIPGHPEGWSI